MAKQAIKLKKNKNGIYRFVIDLPGEKVNILRREVLAEIKNVLTELKEDDSLKFLIIESAKSGNFIAGADINEIKNITDSKEALSVVREGQDVISQFAELKATTICLIDGSCMGGGTELILACDYRLAVLSDKTKMALPEVNLGIIPGFGGTQRLPRLVGLIRSFPLILTGKSVDAKKAFKIGLVDGYFPKEQSKEKLAAFIANLKDGKARHKIRARRLSGRPVYEKIKILDSVIFRKAKRNVLAKTKGHYCAPVVAIDVVKRSYKKPLKEGLRIELEAFSELVIKQVSKNLIDIFFISEKVKKDKGSKASPAEIKNAAVLGAGIMGGGIAWLFTKIDVPVRIKDISYKAIALGYKQVAVIYKSLKRIRKYNDRQISLKEGLLSHSLDYVGYGDSDIVIEAIVEDLKIKKASFKELEKHVKKDTVIASNTSSLSITEMAIALKRPERFVGIHFFNPVNRMPLVEIIAGDKTNSKTIATAVAFVKKTGKTAIVVKDSPGFLVNRILIPYINEAGYLLNDVQDVEQVDKAIAEFGMPMGPFTLADTVGVDVGYKVAKILEEGFGKRMKVSPLLESVYKKNFLGKKLGKGFYKYEGQSSAVNPGICELYDGDKCKISYNEIVDRLILVMVNEASKCLEEGIVANYEYLDLAMIMGTGFPAFRGGILKYADLRGINNVVAILEGLASSVSKERYKPSKLLSKMAKDGTSFY